jgi:hypothetical protein
MKESKAKCCYLKKTRKDFVCFLRLRPPPLLGFCLGRSSSFVGSESGHYQSILYFDFGKGGRVGGGESERRLEGQKFT